MKDDGGTTFPSNAFEKGMSLRDWFAGQALHMGHLQHLDDGDIARCAYAVADAMLREREKES